MTKLTKAQLKQRDELGAKLNGAKEDLEHAVEEYNAALTTAWDEVQQSLDAMNELIDDANSWRTDIAQEIADYISERSEKWQEGDKGQAYGQWQTEWEEDIERIELEKPDDLSLDDIEGDYTQLLESTPEEVSA